MFESCYTPVDIAHRMAPATDSSVELAGCRPSVVCGFGPGDWQSRGRRLQVAESIVEQSDSARSWRRGFESILR